MFRRFRLALAPIVAAILLLPALACGSNGDGQTVAIRSVTPRPTQATSTTATATPTRTAAATPTRAPRFVSLAGLTGNVKAPPLPPGLAQAVPNQNLQQAITKAVTEGSGLSVVVQHLGDGRSAFIHADSVYPAGSLSALLLLYEAFRLREAGELDFGTVVTLEKRHVEADMGTLAFLDMGEGDSYTVGDAVKAVAVLSDAASSALLLELTGGSLGNRISALSLHNTSFDEAALSTSARDMASLLRAIARAQDLDKESRQELLALLLQEGIRDGIVAGLPQDVPAAHKTGAFANVTHDVGIVWSPGGVYIIAVFSDRVDNWQAVVEVSRVAYEYFNGN